MIHLHLNQCANVSSLLGLRLTVKSRHLKYSFDYLPKYTSCYKRIVQKNFIKTSLLKEIIPQRLSAAEHR